MSEFDPEVGQQIAEACVDVFLEMVAQNGGRPIHAVALLQSVVAGVLWRTMPTATPDHDAQALALVHRHAGEMLALLRQPSPDIAAVRQ